MTYSGNCDYFIDATLKCCNLLCLFVDDDGDLVEHDYISLVEDSAEAPILLNGGV